MSTNELEPIRNEDFEPIREAVFNTLRNAILEEKLKPGEHLKERDIAQQLGVSRTPVREAIRKLELEKLVTHIPRKGVIVTSFSSQEVLEIFYIRSALEGLICRLAAEKIRSRDLNRIESILQQMELEFQKGNLKKVNTLHGRFHEIIYQAAESPRLHNMINTLSDYINKFAEVAYQVPGRIQEAIKEHHAIAEALRNKDLMKAEQEAMRHVDSSRKAYLSKIEADGANSY